METFELFHTQNVRGLVKHEHVQTDARLINVAHKMTMKYPRVRGKVVCTAMVLIEQSYCIMQTDDGSVWQLCDALGCTQAKFPDEGGFASTGQRRSICNRCREVLHHSRVPLNNRLLFANASGVREGIEILVFKFQGSRCLVNCLNIPRDAKAWKPPETPFGADNLL